MRVGVSGHQARPRIDWVWVAEIVSEELGKLPKITQALTSLAVGSDQVFAQCALDQGVPVTAVIPMQDYQRFFQEDGLTHYQQLLKQSTPVELDYSGDPQEAFYLAGRYVVDHCDVLLAIWDGKAAAGRGGTGDAVAYAITQGKRCIIIDPIRQTVRHLSE